MSIPHRFHIVPTFVWYIVPLVVAIVGAISSNFCSWSDYPAWRWVTYVGLVTFAAATILGWWRYPPTPPAPPDSAGQRANVDSALTGIQSAIVGGTRVTRFLARYAEPLFTWLVAYPLFPLPFLFFWAVSWGGLGEGLGLPDLVWYETWFQRFWAGLGVSLLFGNLLFVRYLLDDRPKSNPTKLFGERPSLLCFVETSEGDTPDDETGKKKVRRLGAFLLWTWPGTLAVFYLPKLFASAWNELNECGSMLGGLIAGLVLTVGLVFVYEWSFRPCGLVSRFLQKLPGHNTQTHRWSLRSCWQASRFFRNLPGFNSQTSTPIPDTDRHLHSLAGLMCAIPAAFLGLFLLEYYCVGAVWSPVWLLCLMIALFALLYGFVTFHLSGLQYVLLVLGVLVLVVCNKEYPDKMSFPGLEIYQQGATRGKVNLDDPGGPVGKAALVAWDDKSEEDKKKESLQKEEWKASFEAIGLIKTDELLTEFHHHKWANAVQADFEKKKPKLVIVATTGGGIQAAVWTAVVLEGLEKELSKEKTGGAAFRDHIRLITGASGGMQAAGLYAADFERFDKGIPNLMSEQLAEDSLWPTVQKMLIHDFPGVAWPDKFHSDRGRELETAWEFNTRPRLDKGGNLLPAPDRFDDRFHPREWQASPLSSSFARLKPKEATCDRPTLIFSPMLVEDCRRLLISNLEMSWFTSANGSNLNKPLDGVPTDRLAVPAVEFWRLFPHAYGNAEQNTGFKVVTAARMQATFPFVGPAVSLPTEPARRVVDAGYFDNFGINLAALWLYRHKQAILDHTSGVVIVEIRAYPRRNEKLKFSYKKQPKEELLSWAMSELSTPAEAVINLYSRAAYFRNDQFLDVLDKEFNGPENAVLALGGGLAALPPDKKFFTTVVFECNQPAALSWTLPKRDLKIIRQRFFKEKGNLHSEIDHQVQGLRAWFGKGGTR